MVYAVNTVLKYGGGDAVRFRHPLRMMYVVDYFLLVYICVFNKVA